MDDLLKRNLKLFLKEKLNILLKNEGAFLEFPKYRKPMVSIILILYNQAEYTFQCLETIKAYADVPYEIILVDNGSRDETKKLLKKTNNVIVHENKENEGFLRGCNQGAKLAKGKWLLFLNNDTQITPSLLSVLVNTGENMPDCGAVGGKLIFPNGKLQEAGSMIWNNGACLGYGRGENPFNSEFSYVKEVDFCSGACLLVRRDIFKATGMFDELFSPAYYDEVDLCMNIRKLGHKIFFQPAAVVIHYEFGSSSMDAAVGAQIKNREKFFRKWKRELTHFYPANVKNSIFAREHNFRDKYKILMVEDRIPVPEYGSGFPRSYKLLQCMVEAGYRVTLFPLQIPEKIEPYTYNLQQMGIEVIFAIGQEKLNFQDFFTARKHYYDAILISRPHNMKEIGPLIKKLNPHQKIIYDAEALYAARDILRLELENTKLESTEKDRMIKKEIELMNHADIVITVSGREKSLIERYGPRDIRVLGHTIDAKPTPKSFEQRRDILFVGGFLSAPTPNEDAMQYFVQEIYPKVRKATGAKLWIVGTNYLKSIQNLASDHIRVTGKTEDLWDYYNDCKLFVIPTRFAAGIPFKLHECLSHGMPAVVSPLIAEQVQLGEDTVLIGKDPDDFANKIITGYTDKKTWSLLRENGLSYIKTECHHDSFLEKLKGLKTIQNQPTVYYEVMAADGPSKQKAEKPSEPEKQPTLALPEPFAKEVNEPRGFIRSFSSYPKRFSK